MGEDPEFNLTYNFQDYTVTFDGTVPEDEDIVDVTEVIKPLTVKSIAYFGLASSASDPAMPEE